MPRRALTFRPIALMAVWLWIGVSLVLPVRVLWEQQQRIGRAEHRLAALNREALSADRAISRWEDPAYIEAQARVRLGYAFPGERTYVVLSGRTTG